MGDTQMRCHCGGAYKGSDHCPACGCEQYEGRQRCNSEGVPWFKVVDVHGNVMVGPVDGGTADSVEVGFEWFEWDEVRSVTRVEMVKGRWQPA